MASGFWRAATNSNWSATTSWWDSDVATGGVAVATVPGSLETAYFSSAVAGAVNVYLNGSRTVGSVENYAGYNVTILGGTSTTNATQTLTIDGNVIRTYSANLTIGSTGTPKVNVKADSLYVYLDGAGTLTFNNTLSPNTLNAGSSYVDVRSYSTGNAVFAGAITDVTGTPLTFYTEQLGTGTVTLSGANTFTGGMTVFAPYGAKVVLNVNTGSLSTNVNNYVQLYQNGKFELTNSGATTSKAASLPALYLDVGENTLTLTRAATQTVTATFANFSQGSAVLNVVYGGTPGTIGTNSKISFTAGMANVNGIVPGVYYNGSDFATYAAGYVNVATYKTATAGTSFSTPTIADVMNQTGPITAQGTATISALRMANALAGNNDLTISPGATLTVDSILKAGGSSGRIDGGTITSSNATLYVRAATASDALTIYSAVNASIYKTGPGSLTVWGPVTAANTVYADGAITFQGGGTFSGGITALGTAPVVTFQWGSYSVLGPGLQDLGTYDWISSGDTNTLVVVAGATLNTTALDAYQVRTQDGGSFNVTQVNRAYKYEILSSATSTISAATTSFTHWWYDGFVKSGPGRLDVTGAALYKYSGTQASSNTVSVNEGTYGFGHASAAAIYTFNAGTSFDTVTSAALTLTPVLAGTDVLKVLGIVTFLGTGDLNINRPLQLQLDTTLTVNASNLTVGELKGNWPLTKSGPGTLTLSANSTRFGNTVIAEGTVVAAAASPFSAFGSTITFSGGTLRHGTGITTDFSSSFSNNAPQAWVIDANGQTVTYASTLAGTGNSFTVVGGTVRLISPGNSFTGPVVVRNGATLQVTALSNGGSSGTLGASTSAVGNLVLDGGTLSVAHSTGSAASSNRIITVTENGGALSSDGTTSSSTVSWSGAVTPAGASGTFTLRGSYTNTSSTTLSGIISGGLSLAKTGAARWNITGANTFTGGVSVTGGELYANNATALGSTSVPRTMSVDGGTFLPWSSTSSYPNLDITLKGSGGSGQYVGASYVAGATFTAKSFTLLGPTTMMGYGWTTNGPIDNGGFALALQGYGTASGTFSGVVSGAGAVTVGSSSNTGAITLSNVANTYTGKTTVAFGTLNAPVIANAGVVSSIGAPTGDAATIALGNPGSVGATTFAYTGAASTATDRPFEIRGNVGSHYIRATAAGALLTLNGAITGAAVTGPIQLRFGNVIVNTALGDFNGYATGVQGTAGNTYLGSANTYSGVTSAAGYLYGDVLKNVGAGPSSFGAPTTVAGGTFDLASGGGIVYTGTATSTDRRATLTGGGVIRHHGTGVLSLTGDIANNSVSGGTLTLGGNNNASVGTPLSSAYGDIVVSGAITEASVNSPLAVAQSGNNKLTLTGNNTFTGIITTGGGVLSIPAASALGGAAPSRYISSFSQVKFPNAITIPDYISLVNGGGNLRPGRETYALYEFNAPSTVAGGVGTTVTGTTGALTIQANDDVTFRGAAVVGSIAVAAGKTVTFAPTTTTTTTTAYAAFLLGVYDLDIPISVNAQVGMRVSTAGVPTTAYVSGVTRSPGAGYTRLRLSTATTGVGVVGQAVSLITEAMAGVTNLAGPGTIVLKGAIRSYSPYLRGATLRHIIDGVSSFGNSAFLSSGQGYSNYGSSDSVLEFSNEGAVTGGSKSWSASFNVGTVTVRNMRVAPYDLKVSLGLATSGTQQWSTTYFDNTAAGTLSATNGVDVSTATLGRRINSAAFISDGVRTVPAYRHADGYVTYPVYGTTALFNTQAGGSTITSAGATQSVNLTAPVTAQGTAQMDSIRLAEGSDASIAIQSGARLSTGLIMDSVTGASRTIVSGGKLSGLNGFLTLYSANTEGSVVASPIDLGLGTAVPLALVKAGPGKVVHTAPVRTNNVMALNEGTWEFQAGFDSGASYSVNLASPASGAVELRVKARSRTQQLAGGGVNSRVVLDGADLEIWGGTSNSYWGDISGTGKLVKTGHNGSATILGGKVDGVGLELFSGSVELNTAYGTTTLNNPPVTFKGAATINSSHNQTAYAGELAYGALILADGSAGTVTHYGISNNPGGAQVTSFTSLVRAGTNYLTIGNAVPPTPTAYTRLDAGNFGYIPAASLGNAQPLVRLQAGQALVAGGVAPVDGVLDRMVYGSGRDAWLGAVLVPPGATMGAVNGGHVFINGAITAQTSISVQTLNMGGSALTMAAGQALSVDQIISGSAVVTGALQTANTQGDGALYLNSAGTYAGPIQDGAVPTRLVRPAQTTTLSGTNTYTAGTWFLGGTTTAATDAALGAVPATPTDNLYFSGGNLTITTGGLSDNRSIVAVGGASVITFPAAGATYAGKISGPGLLTIAGGAYATPVVISGNNADYTGAVWATGVLKITHDNALGAGTLIPGNIFVLGAGVTSAYDPSARIDRVTAGLTLENASGNTITLGSTIQPGYQIPFVKRGPNPIVIDAEQGFSSVTLGYSQPLSGTNVAGGVLRVTKTNGLGFGTVTVVAGNTAGDAQGAALEISGGITLPNNFATSGYGYAASGGVYPGTGVVRSLSGDNVITGTYSLASGAGPTTIGVDAGSLTIQGAVSASGTGRNITLVGAGDLSLDGGLASTNAPAINVVGSGRMFMRAANASSGTIGVSSGTYVAAHASALGSDATTNLSGTGKLAVTVNATARRVNFGGSSELVLG